MSESEIKKFILEIVRLDVKQREFSCEKHKRDPEACVGLRRARKALAYISNLWSDLDK